ncbi:unnamed protein product [Nippostrongylus brasiliensis]|uniref:DDE_Tnp_1_7 domain-containing protein n=1 Tax=Nippostrongylus brasiliensis TaxID=27835 RepID=A0A0N4Y572_NIPBR|nr:unnamed protein product [Nippostrongylus brasiliensis]
MQLLQYFKEFYSDVFLHGTHAWHPTPRHETYPQLYPLTSMRLVELLSFLAGQLQLLGGIDNDSGFKQFVDGLLQRQASIRLRCPFKSLFVGG